jgi:hydrogenase nickel incorporation protein HypA/HybF
MHEVSLCESILRIIERQAKKERFTRVVKITIELGKNSCASEESLSFCFPLVAKGTRAEEATLGFIHMDHDVLKVVELRVE